MRRLAEMLGALFGRSEHEKERQQILAFEARVEAHERKIDRWAERQRRLVQSTENAGRAMRRKR